MKEKGSSLQDTVAKPGEELDDTNDYETENHLRTLIDAHRIMSDKVKMAKVHKLAGRHDNAIKGIKSLDQMKDHYNKKFGGKNALKRLASNDGDGE